MIENTEEKNITEFNTNDLDNPGPATIAVPNHPPTEYALVYHRYNLGPRPCNAWEDTISPVIASIATLRAYNNSLKIYILDTEPILENWGDFPSILDFHVVQQPPQIPIAYTGGCEFQSRIVSRPWDVWEFSRSIPERYIIYSDSDVFWRSDPLPLAGPVDHFWGDPRGDGYFYFDKHQAATEVFFNCWRAMIVAGILSQEIRTKMRISQYQTPMYMAEMGYCYLVRNGMTAGWSEIPYLDHYYPSTKTRRSIPRRKTSMLTQGCSVLIG